MRKIFWLFALLWCKAATGQDIAQIKNTPPVTFRGALTSGFQAYKVWGIDPRSANPMWNLSGSANLSIYGIEIPMSFTIGRQGRELSYPAFKQFGASPKYRWITLHAGWRNLQFSPYTLAGHSFLGAGIDLNPGKFRFSAMKGRFRQARPAAITQENAPFPEVYRRDGYALKIGVGSERSYFDLIYLRAKDDPNSIKLADSTITPSENAVWGYATRIRMGRKIGFFSDGAISMFTRNLNSATVEDSSRIPDIPTMLRPRFSTRLNYAVRGGIDFQFSKFSIRTTYERIAPNFETMGAYFFNNDIENILLAPNFGFAKNKGRFNGSLGLQRNNLAGNRSETTRRVIGNASMNFNPGPLFGFSANYMHAGIHQYDGAIRLNDSIRIAVVNSNMSVSPYWNWSDSLHASNFLLSANYQQLNDRNPFTRTFAQMQTAFFLANYSFSRLTNGWGYQLGANFNHIEVFNLKSNRYGGTAGINKTFGKGLGSAALTATANLSSINGKKDGAVWSASLQFSQTFAGNFQISVFTNVLKNDSTAFDDYTEWQGGATITRTFNPKKKKQAQQ